MKGEKNKQIRRKWKEKEGKKMNERERPRVFGGEIVLVCLNKKIGVEYQDMRNNRVSLSDVHNRVFSTDHHTPNVL